MKRKNAIIIYSWSTLWSMKNKSGAPSFYKTVELYNQKGWEVFLIMTDATKGGNTIVDDEHLFVLPSWKSDKLIGPQNWTKGFLLLKLFRYNAYAKKITEMIMKKANVKVFYAYEVQGVEVAKQMSKKYNKPVVTRFQGTVATYFKDNLATKIKQHFTLKALKTEADLVIMTDDGTKGLQTLKKLGNPSKNIKFWRNGLDLIETGYNTDSTRKKELRDKLNIADDEYMLLTVSRLQDWKRVDRAIVALAEVVKKSNKFKLVIAGDGPEKERLEKLAKELNVNDNVTFLGAVNHDMIYDYMSSADIFLSLYDMSNVGNPLLEALTLGKAVITLDVGDTSTVVKNGKNGILLKVDELNLLPQKMYDLYMNKEVKNKLENGAKEYSKENFYSWKTRMEMEHAEIEKIIK